MIPMEKLDEIDRFEVLYYAALSLFWLVVGYSINHEGVL